MIRVGTDIIEIARIEKNIKNPAFLKRVYSPKELALFPEPRPVQSLAARFCAKEALIKVFGEWVPFHEITVLNDAAGRPFYELSGTAEAKRRSLKIDALDLSLSHCEEYAVAFAVGLCAEERMDGHATD
ncbi:MAG: holo-ACP synthase [Bacillota bacterium]|jgi:holo-[acyl-carrier protein] synthase